MVWAEPRGLTECGWVAWKEVVSLVLTCLEVRELNENPVNFELIHSTQDPSAAMPEKVQKKFLSSGAPSAGGCLRCHRRS